MAIQTGATGEAADFLQQADRDATPSNDGGLGVRLESSGYLHPQQLGITGVILPYGGDSAPANWLICDGSAVSRSTYAELFDVVGTKYGNGDGSTTFNLPDLQKRVPAGYDGGDTDFDTVGQTGGEKEVSLSSTEMPEHSHDVVNDIMSESGATLGTGSNIAVRDFVDNGSSYNNDESLETEEEGNGSAHQNMPPYVVVNYIIGT